MNKNKRRPKKRNSQKELNNFNNSDPHFGACESPLYEDQESDGYKSNDLKLTRKQTKSLRS